MTDQNARAMLSQLDGWARDKLKGESEPPWAWFNYMKLREVIGQIVRGQDSTGTPIPEEGEVPLPM